MGIISKIIIAILLVIVIVESLFIFAIFKLGFDAIEEENMQIEKENYCIVNVCEDYEAYQYYPETSLCECYTDGYLEHEEVIR